MASPAWVKTLLKTFFPQRFFLAKATNLPFVGRVVEKAMFEGDDIIYLPKDSVVDVNQSLEDPESLVVPSQVLDHFIKSSNYRFIMNTCICREGDKCKDYPIDIGCLFLGEAVLDINPKFGRLATTREALDHARRAREAGLVHLIGRNKLDTLWLNVGPKEKLLTVCNCCPCCCLWKILPDVSSSIASKVKPMPGVTVTVGEDCVGCGICSEDVCFVNAISLKDGKAQISEECRGCGRCVEACPKNAIILNYDGPENVDDSIARIAELVDLG